MPDQWTFSAASGFTLSTTGARIAYVPTDSAGIPKKLPVASAVIAQVPSTAYHVGICVYGTGDLNTCWRIGIDGTNVFLQKETFGSLAGAVASAAHGITSGVPYTIQVRPSATTTGTVIQVYINNNPVPSITYDVTTILTEFGCFGFDSDQNGAIVSSFEVASLVPTYLARADIPWWVCGGEFWVSTDGLSLTLVERRAMNATGQVDGDDLDQIVYLADGANARKFDPAAMTVAKWTAVQLDGTTEITSGAGSLPGANGAGTTDFTIITNHSGRILGNEEQNIIGSSINEALRWDTSEDAEGAQAFALSATVAAKIGQPVKAMVRMSNTVLLIGCSRSLWLMRGDLVLGTIEIAPILEGIGITGKDAAARVSDNMALVHTTQGLYLVNSAGGSLPLSRNLMTTFLTVDTVGTEYLISLVRDVKRSGTLVFITPVTEGEATHVWYDERTGKFSSVEGGGAPPDGPAFFPEQYPTRVGPTCAMEFDGRVLMGGRDGYIYTFGDTLATDDGDTIASRMAMLCTHEEDLVSGIRLHAIESQLTVWSGPVDIKVYSGLTAEEAYEGSNRSLRRVVRSSRTRSRHTIDVAGPALVVEVHGVAGERWGMEPIQAATAPDTMSRASRFAIPAAEALCAAAVAASGGTPGTGPGPGDDPSGGGSTKCTACATWMAANTGGVVDGHDAVLLVPQNGLLEVQAALPAAIAALLAADICDLSSDPTLWVTNQQDPADWPPQAIAYSALMAIQQGDLPPGLRDDVNKTWMVYFRCEDQPGIA